MQVSVSYFLAEIVIAITAVVGNSLVLVTYARSSRLQTVTNYFIVSLAIADFLVGLVGVPFALLTGEGQPHNFYGCLIMLNFLLWLCATSTFSLIGVTVDRYIAVAFPLKYPGIMTTRRALATIVGSWILAGIVGFLPVVGWNRGEPEVPRCIFMEVIDMKYMAFNCLVVIFVPFTVMLVLYGFIYRAIRKQLRRVGISGGMLSNPPSTISGVTTVGNANVRRKRRFSAYKRDVKAVKSVGVIILVFAFCWLPLSIINTRTALCPDCTPPSATVFNVIIVLSHVNSAVNPFIYAYGKDFRVAYKRTICKLFPCCSYCMDGGMLGTTVAAMGMSMHYGDGAVESVTEQNGSKP
ncbi:adenosine receptor A2a-like [Asterias amurensis]|uniref:adenosine receptor A2a-like n=1 Tax=Asterias amurensis TaxID=7602 RepID=UPI003AB57DA3